jgi:hypothetical protein
MKAVSRTKAVKRRRAVKKPRAVVKKLPAVVKTRREWAAEIRAIQEQTIENILKMGRTFIAAKKALAHGEFTKMIEHDLRIDASTVQRLMKIARDPRIRKAARAQLLPSAWGALYELTKLSDAKFKQAMASGAINSQMTGRQARTVRIKVTEETRRLVAPYYSVMADDDKPVTKVVPIYKTADADATQSQPTDLPKVASLFSEIKRLLGVVAMAVERGDVRADDVVFKECARAVADQALNLIRDCDGGRSIN